MDVKSGCFIAFCRGLFDAFGVYTPFGYNACVRLFNRKFHSSFGFVLGFSFMELGLETLESENLEDLCFSG